MAKLYFYYSAMNAGKTTNLLQASYNYNERGMQVLLFTPELDDRIQRGAICSRIGLKKEAIGFHSHFSFTAYVTQQKAKQENLRCLLIDEAQFLTKAQVAQLAKIATECNIAVLCYGLRSDFVGEPFEGSQYLLAWAHEIIECKTICRCSRKATMNMRIDAQGQPLSTGSQVHIGGNESYESVCMHCFQEQLDVFTLYAHPTKEDKHCDSRSLIP